MLQHRTVHLPDKKFGFNEYSEYSDNDEKDKASLSLQWDSPLSSYDNGHISKTVTDSEVHPSDLFDKSE